MLTGCTAPMRQYRLFESSDVEETEARIAEVMQPHRLNPVTSQRGHAGHMDFLRMPSIGIGVIGFGQMGLVLDEVEDYHLMIFCTKGRARLTSGKSRVIASNDQGACLAPGDPLKGDFTPDCEQLVFRVDAQAMRRYTGLRNPRLPQLLDLHHPSFGPWANIVRMMVSDAPTLDLIGRDERVAADFETLFFTTLLASGVQREDDRFVGAAPGPVRRAESYIDAHYGNALTLPEIAEAAGVPVRTLLTGFRRFRGTSPMKYLLDRRLDEARERLVTARECETVLDCALDVGFAHLGRFAARYSERFGESPSQTLRRAGGGRKAN